jgi:NAD(P) transhydrogenase subunit alpha
VQIIGQADLATMLAEDASALYARNVLDFLKLVTDKDGQFFMNLDDEIVAATLLCAGGELRRK